MLVTRLNIHFLRDGLPYRRDYDNYAKRSEISKL